MMIAGSVLECHRSECLPSTVLRQDAANTVAEKSALEEKLAELLSERDSIQLKVEAMLDAMTMIDADVAEAVGR